MEKREVREISNKGKNENYATKIREGAERDETGTEMRFHKTKARH